MRRREFIAVIGGAVLTWPMTARAQQADRMRKIGVLMGWPESDPEAQSRPRITEIGLGGRPQFAD